MNVNELKNKPLWQMTGEELLCLLQSEGIKEQVATPVIDTSKKYVYGIAGIVDYLGAVCRLPIASNRVGKLKRQSRK